VGLLLIGLSLLKAGVEVAPVPACVGFDQRDRQPAASFQTHEDLAGVWLTKLGWPHSHANAAISSDGAVWERGEVGKRHRSDAFWPGHNCFT